ncbi:sporulation initiation phosphotransferase B [Lederbergia sp. NSJ-179]|uniref:Spo0B C-terminal domain-containing protein n=1 Tax=Lederbergia sp. NSJ-179 TaxID=2931402 RepID=UPI001FD05A9B|nr:Spo0B C-terminal domain-containing protein [Lederbergia sp. NSJ-179]MCJ7839910.1 sporulation initiation phosphotransferase B [Lederbergia sp. NSJ-179]
MMKDKEEALTLLQHVRHDWLNRIQLIKSYLTLGKIDQAERVIEEVILESQQEARLTKLGLPEFATLLLFHNWGWGGHTFQIEYEVIHDLPAHYIDDLELTSWMTNFFHSINEVLHPLYGHQLYITIESMENRLSCIFDYEGKLKNLDRLQQWLLTNENDQVHINMEKASETEFSCKVIFEGSE